MNRNPKVEDRNPKIEDENPKNEDKNPIFSSKLFPNSKLFPDISISSGKNAKIFTIYITLYLGSKSKSVQRAVRLHRLYLGIFFRTNVEE